jgi:TetR/AcrR family transcriptional regulator, fatty acid metabolism regulator protein
MSRVREAGLEDRILDTAFEVFGERGFQATTIKDIAAGAAISSGSIYTYFPDKESLFKATVTRTWETFIDELEKLCEGTLSQAERVASLYERGFSVLAAAVPLVKGMFVEAAKLNLIEPYLDRVCAAVDRILEPERGSESHEYWKKTVEKRLVITRMMVLGILASTALMPTDAVEEDIERLREASRALLSQAAFMMNGGQA